MRKIVTVPRDHSTTPAPVGPCGAAPARVPSSKSGESHQAERAGAPMPLVPVTRVGSLLGMALTQRRPSLESAPGGGPSSPRSLALARPAQPQFPSPPIYKRTDSVPGVGPSWAAPLPPERRQRRPLHRRLHCRRVARLSCTPAAAPVAGFLAGFTAAAVSRAAPECSALAWPEEAARLPATHPHHRRPAWLPCRWWTLPPRRCCACCPPPPSSPACTPPWRQVAEGPDGGRESGSGAAGPRAAAVSRHALDVLPAGDRRPSSPRGSCAPASTDSLAGCCLLPSTDPPVPQSVDDVEAAIPEDGGLPPCLTFVQRGVAHVMGRKQTPSFRIRLQADPAKGQVRLGTARPHLPALCSACTAQPLAAPTAAFLLHASHRRCTSGSLRPQAW